MDPRSYVVRPYRAGDEERIVALFNDVFGGEEGAEPRTLAQWRWLYAANPAGTRIVVGEESDGRLISHYAALPCRFQVGASVMAAGQIVDSMVRADRRAGLRREGVFLRTAHHFFERHSDPAVNAGYFGFPNRHACRIGRRFLRYEPFVAPVPVLFRNFFQDPDDDEVGQRFDGSLHVAELAAFGEDADLLWLRLAPSYPFAIVRDRAYLAWRYDACPHAPYRRFELRGSDGRLRGWFVTRERWLREPILALVDLLVAPDDEAAVAVALRHATRLARETGHVRVETWLPENHPTFRHARRAGFRVEAGLCAMALDLLSDRVTRSDARATCYYTLGDSDFG